MTSQVTGWNIYIERGHVSMQGTGGATYIYSMEPSHLQRRAVLRVSFQTEPVPPVDHVVTPSLRPRAISSYSFPISILLLLLIRLLRRVWRLGCVATRTPGRQSIDASGQKARLRLWGGHSVKRRLEGASVAEYVAEPALVTPPLCGEGVLWMQELCAAMRNCRPAKRQRGRYSRCQRVGGEDGQL